MSLITINSAGWYAFGNKIIYEINYEEDDEKNMVLRFAGREGEYMDALMRYLTDAPEGSLSGKQVEAIGGDTLGFALDENGERRKASVFAKQYNPEAVSIFTHPDELPLVDVIHNHDGKLSKKEIVRRIEAGAVSVDGVVIKDKNHLVIRPNEPITIKYGKRNIFRLTPDAITHD